MSKVKLIEYVNRAKELEIDLKGIELLSASEELQKLKELIQAEMESLGTWDGDLFKDKAEESALTIEEEKMQIILQKCDNDLMKALLERLNLKVEKGDNWKDRAMKMVMDHDVKLVIVAVSELAADERGESEDNDGTGEPEGGNTEEETNEEETETEEGELSDEELEVLMDKNSAAVEAADYYQRKELCGALEITKGGKKDELADRLFGYEDHDAQQLAIAIEAAGLTIVEVSEEAVLAREQRERRNMLAEMKDTGIPAILSSVRVLRMGGNLEGALALAIDAKELWPKSSELVDLCKSVGTMIKDRDEAASIHERRVQQEKLEKKSKGRGRKAKVATIQDCRDACNDLIIVTQAAKKALAAEGKANRRLLNAEKFLGRMLKNQYR